MNRLEEIFIWIGRGTIVLMIWGAIVLVVNLVIMPLYTRQGSEIPVPDTRGKLVSEANAIYKKRGFKIIVDDKRYDAMMPTGIILDQFPPPGGWTKRGRRIHVSVSAGPPFAVVPGVLGMPREDAEFAVQRIGSKIEKIEYAFSDSVYEGQVVDQLPAEGDTVSKADGVQLTVSLGSEPAEYIMPLLIGLPRDQAKYLIMKSGLVVGRIEYDRYARKRNGEVVIQNPSAGAVLAARDTVQIVVNRK